MSSLITPSRSQFGIIQCGRERNNKGDLGHLIKLYEVKSLHTLIFLKRKLYTLRMSESTIMTDHINHLNTLFAQLSVADFNIVENKHLELLLQSLPNSYDQLITNITNNIIIGHLHFEDVT